MESIFNTIQDLELRVYVMRTRSELTYDVDASIPHRIQNYYLYFPSCEMSQVLRRNRKVGSKTYREE